MCAKERKRKLNTLDETADAKDDPAYGAIGKTLTLRELCEEMIARGSLRAESLLIQRLDAARIRNRLHELGADGVEFVAPLESDTGPAEGLGIQRRHAI